MIRFRLSELLAEAQFKTGRRTTLIELSDATGVSRITLSRMLNVRQYSTTTDTIDKLCKFFGCTTSDVAVYVDDDQAALSTVASSPTSLSNETELPKQEGEVGGPKRRGAAAKKAPLTAPRKSNKKAAQ